MTAEDEKNLRRWVRMWLQAGVPFPAALVEELLDERDVLRAQNLHHCERIAAQSEVLTRAAERLERLNRQLEPTKQPHLLDVMAAFCQENEGEKQGDSH